MDSAKTTKDHRAQRKPRFFFVAFAIFALFEQAFSNRLITAG
jgi:hypothetical protein